VKVFRQGKWRVEVTDRGYIFAHPGFIASYEGPAAEYIDKMILKKKSWQHGVVAALPLSMEMPVSLVRDVNRHVWATYYWEE